MERNPWIEKQAIAAVKRAQDRWGVAWEMLPDNQKAGAVAEEIVLLLTQVDPNENPLVRKLQMIAARAQFLASTEPTDDGTSTEP